MLDIVRSLVSSIFGKILLAIMVLSFALWGVGDILTSGNSKLAAKVGNEKITLDEFYFKFQESVSIYNNENQKNLNLKEATDLQLHNILINDLVFEKMITNYAKDNNFYISNNSLKLVITDLPQFKNKEENFSEIKYRNYILNNFQNEEAFLKNIEGAILQGLIFESLNTSNFMNDKIVDLLFRYEGEKRSINYITLNPESISIDKNLQQLEQFYENNSLNYLVDEKIFIDYINIDLNTYKNFQSISDNSIFDYYNNNIDSYTKDEIRKIVFVRFKDKNESISFFNEWQSNIDIEEYANQSNVKFNELQISPGQNFNDEINNVIFNLEVNEISQPIEFDEIGYYIFKVIEIEEEAITPIKDVYEEIKDILATEEAYIFFDEAINESDEMLINDYNFDEISQSLRNVQVIKNVEINKFKENIVTDGYSISYSDPVGFISELIIANDNAYIYRINSKKEKFIPSLDSIQDEVFSDFKEKRTKEILVSIADKIILDLQFKGMENFEKYAESNNFVIKSIENISRNSDELTEETIKNIFKLNNENNFVLKTNDGVVGVGIVSQIIEPDDSISDVYFKTIKNNIVANFNFSLETLLGKEIILSTPYEIYLQNIDQLFM